MIAAKLPKPRLLIVDDDEVDPKMIKRCFTSSEVFTAKNGLDALRLLRGDDLHQPLARPFLVLLDLSMPRMSGIEFLQTIRKDDQLRDLVVFVMTTSDLQSDKAAAYQQQVAGYICKERLGYDYTTLVDFVHSYWDLMELPAE